MRIIDIHTHVFPDDLARRGDDLLSRERTATTLDQVPGVGRLVGAVDVERDAVHVVERQQPHPEGLKLPAQLALKWGLSHGVYFAYTARLAQR